MSDLHEYLNSYLNDKVCPHMTFKLNYSASCFSKHVLGMNFTYYAVRWVPYRSSSV